MKTRRMTIRFPAGGVNKRTSFQTQPPYTAYAANNAWPDNVADGRERGGVRPGLTTAVSGTLPGPIRMLHEINVATETGTESVLVCSANGGFYRYNATDGDWDNVSSSFTLATDRSVQAAVFGQKLYIADWGIATSGDTMQVDRTTNTIVHLPDVVGFHTDGYVAADGVTFTSRKEAGSNGALNATGLVFTAGGASFLSTVDEARDVLRITSTGAGGHAVVGVYSIVSVDSDTQLTLATQANDDGTSTDTSVDFEVNEDYEAESVVIGNYLRIKSTGTSGNVVTGAYEITAVDQDRLTLATDCTSDSTATDSIDHEIRPQFSSTTLSSDNHGLEILEAGNGTAGFYVISSVDPDQLTLASSPGATNTASIEYRVHRTPKVWTLTDDPSTDTIEAWTASAGTLPLSCNVICYFHDRIILAGAPSYPQVWYASAMGDPTDFNYDGDDVESAVAGNNFTGGQVGDPITALIPHNRQCLVIGAEDSLYVLRGDPNSPSATLDQLSDVLGPISPQAWCKDSSYRTWMLTRNGIYVMPQGCGETPTSFSREKLPNDLLNISNVDFNIHMAYDDLQRAVHLYVYNSAIHINGTNGVGSSTSFTSASYSNWATAGVEVGDYLRYFDGGDSTDIEITGVSGGTLTLASSALDAMTDITFEIRRNTTRDDVAYWFDADRGGIWPMTIDRTLRPTAVATYRRLADENKAPVILGTVGGKSLLFDRNATTDSGLTLTSSITIGPFPISRSSFERSIVRTAKLIPVDGTTQVNWSVRTAPTPEEAATASALSFTHYDNVRSASYSITSGYLQTQHPRLSGHAAVVLVSGTGAFSWGVEQIDLEVAEQAGRLR